MSVNNHLFAPIQSRRTFDEISQEIKKYILNGRLRAGDRLPTEADLAHQFNVGRQTIREAMRILEQSGFIAVQKGGNGGPIIKNNVLETVNTLLLDAFHLENLSLEEITRARREIERIVLLAAFEHCDETDLEALEKNIGQAKQKIAQSTSAFDENLDFHILLAQASKNRIFVVVVRTIMSMLGALLRQLDPTPGISKVALDAHEEILAALRFKNKEKALLMLEKHLEEVNDRLQSPHT